MDIQRVYVQRIYCFAIYKKMRIYVLYIHSIQYNIINRDRAVQLDNLCINLI